MLLPTSNPVTRHPWRDAAARAKHDERGHSDLTVFPTGVCGLVAVWLWLPNNPDTASHPVAARVGGVLVALAGLALMVWLQVRRENADAQAQEAEETAVETVAPHGQDTDVRD